ncbi:probable aspartic proteinase GIP2 [Rhodamnia argentea]|uniref:Gamma conglutin 1-like n=1 Tax=Rhodamnia argentea TaxID=178133 RepID=A0A8B8PN43_9MYRT|nr:probable aspartic proteinase GIP2 [Rhodamnia argentea]XP_048137312.1 probable aspartic proteinase GIP2 [Rhodamnia argentea]
MASKSFLLLMVCSILSVTFPLTSQASFRPKALVLPVAKDSSTLQYLATLHQRTPLVPVKLTLDLGGEFLWVDCNQSFSSSTYSPVHCRSAQCSQAPGAPHKFCSTCLSRARPGCSNNTCSLIAKNTVIQFVTNADLSRDVVSAKSTDGSRPGRAVSVPGFVFSCTYTFLLEGLASGVKGMAGLGRAGTSLPSQFSASFRFARKFAICLSPSSSSSGVAFFGDGPYMMRPGIDVSKFLYYTPLVTNPVNSVPGQVGNRSAEYYIELKTIAVNGKPVPLNSSLLVIDKEGYGGTKISTVDPYTVLETSIYKAVVGAFTKGLSQAPRVAPIKPFGECFDSRNISSTRAGPAVPRIDLFLPSMDRKRVSYWMMSGVNSMVQVKEGVMCLGIVDGGLKPVTPVVIGGHQLENHLLQFDLASSALGISSSLLLRQTTCSNFNFNPKA